MDKMKEFNLANPITGHANQLASLFVMDEEVTTKFDYKNSTLRIYVDDAGKALALSTILKSRITLGKLWLDVAVYTPNGKRIVKNEKTKKSNKKIEMTPSDLKILWRTAFKGNKSYRRVLQAVDRAGCVWTFVLFGRRACSWQNDDIQNPELASSALPEQIVKTFADRHTGVQISTDVERLWLNK